MALSVQELRRAARARLKHVLGKSATWRRRVQVWLVLGGIATAGGGELLQNYAAEPEKPWFGAMWAIGLCLAFLGGIVLAVVDDGEADTLIVAEEALERAEECEQSMISIAESFDWLGQLYGLGVVLREIIEASLREPPAVLLPAMEQMVDFLVARKEVLLGMGRDRWNISVYSHNPASDLLECVICRRRLRIEEQAPHRSWAPGEGHVGIAHQRNRIVIAPDTSRPEAREVFDPEGANHRTDDHERYRSIAALPITLNGGSIGVLVATSDEPNRFTMDADATGRDNVEALRTLVTALAMLHHVNHLARRRGVE